MRALQCAAMKVFALVIGLGVVGCAGASHTMIGPGMYAIECKRSQSNCWEEANEVCGPGQYDVLDRSGQSGTHHMVNAYNGQYMGSVPTYKGELIVQCKSPATAAAQ